ncbi:unnamed protein product [Heligmosomoides polygyrus]|uniref:Reverse transcriptase domain-containing protein n=1 Tax=Heligmosomoides polygyrus TaxID=6339 RepID=A0A3P8DPR7_HELPZ|nr:unnamed protein product [Heligmosomoides polygyrus]
MGATKFDVHKNDYNSRSSHANGTKSAAWLLNLNEQEAIWCSWKFDGVSHLYGVHTLLYADNVLFACEGKEELEREVQARRDRLERFGLRLNVKKAEYLTMDVTKSAFIKIYRAVVRPVAVYGAECCPVTKEVEARLNVMESKMLRWTPGVTCMDRIRNGAIFGRSSMGKKRSDIQGLRGWAIILVILYHYFPEHFRNGYLGVDV